MANENLIVPRFFMLPVHNEVESRKQGRPIFDDIEVCEIALAANRQSKGHFPAHEVFKSVRDLSTGEINQITYAMEYKDQYLKFKNNEVQGVTGTPLSELPFLTQSKRLELKALNIHTAEALAMLDGLPLKQLGMGGRELKNQAQLYLDNAKGSANIVELAAQNAMLIERITALENAKTSGIAVSTDNDDYIPNEPIAAPEDPNASPFAIMDSADIKNWIKEATGEPVRGNPSHATLVARADEVNAAIKKKSEQAAA